MPRFLPRRRSVPVTMAALSLLVLAALALPCRAADDPAFVTLLDGIPEAIQLAAPPTGQTLYVLDGDSGRVTAVDPFDPSKRWTAIRPDAVGMQAAEGGPGRPAGSAFAIGCIDSNTLAVVFRTGKDDAWSVGTYRLAPPGSTTESAVRIQTLPLGVSPGESGRVEIVVSPSREWLAVVGLQAPLPAILRAPIAGARIGTFSDRRCPRLPPSHVLVGATISPFDDEWVLFLSETPGDKGSVFLKFHPNAGGQELLRLDTGLTSVRDAAYCRESATLWAVGGRDDLSGLWRIDAVLKDGRQAARATHVVALENPLSVVCLSERAIAVVAGGAARKVVLVNPTTATQK